MAVALATFLIVLAIVVLFVGDFSREQAIESVDFNTIRAGQLSGGHSFAVTISWRGRRRCSPPSSKT